VYLLLGCIVVHHASSFVFPESCTAAPGVMLRFLLLHLLSQNIITPFHLQKWHCTNSHIHVIPKLQFHFIVSVLCLLFVCLAVWLVGLGQVVGGIVAGLSLALAPNPQVTSGPLIKVSFWGDSQVIPHTA